jgi:hypothetical protein
MFETTLDSEHVFGHHRAMIRTRVRRRRRMVAAMVSVAVAVVVGAPVAGAIGRHGPDDTRVLPAKRWEQVYVVRVGDTVWSIAARAAVGADPRVMVDAIAVRNDIDVGAVVPGQAIVIPRVA